MERAPSSILRLLGLQDDSFLVSVPGSATGRSDEDQCLGWAAAASVCQMAV